MKIISRSVFAGLFLIAGLSSVVPTDVYAAPTARHKLKTSKKKLHKRIKRKAAASSPQIALEMAVSKEVSPSVDGTLKGDAQHSGSVLRGPTCPGPDDALPAYSLEDIRAAIVTDANARIKLCQSIDGVGAQVFPVTYDPTEGRSSAFSGALFGNNFEIANLELIQPSGNRENLGLFELIQGPGDAADGVRAQVRDVALRNIRAPRNPSLASLRAEGILAGRIQDAEIRNISIAESSVGGANTAVGLMAGFLGDSEVTDIRLNGVVGDVRPLTGFSHGGLAGWAFESSIERVVLSGLQVNNGPSSSYSSPQSGYTGGVVGQARAVTFRDIRGTVSASSAVSVLGGVAGYNNDDAALTFERINLAVNLRGSTPTSGDSIKPGTAGGVVGYSYGPVHIVDTKISGPIEASGTIGGLVGKINHYNPYLVTSSIERSAYLGDELSAFSQIGGLVGSTSYSGMMIRDCFVQANLRGLSSLQLGFGGIGGLVGNLTQEGAPVGLEFINSYFSGTVSILPAGIGEYEVGGLVGYRVGPVAVSQALFDGELLPEAMRTNSFGIPAASQAMRNDQALYAGWDFASTWRFTPGQLPTLRALDRQAADVNGDGAVTPEDIFAFLEFFFSHNLAGDLNHDGVVTLQDLFDFLGLYFLANS